MIRALFGFFLTLLLLAGGALWALGVFDRAEGLRASPPISRTVEIFAQEISRQLESDPRNPLGPARAAVATAIDRVAPGADAAAPQPETDRPATGAQSVDDAAPAEEARSHDAARERELGSEGDGDLAGGTEALNAAHTVRETEVTPTRSAALADSALLVRRMLGLYEQSLEPR